MNTIGAVKRPSCWAIGTLLLLLCIVVHQEGVSSPANSKDLSNMTNVGAGNTITSPLDVGFQNDEELISTTNTLQRPYYVDTSAEASTNFTNNNNLCESASDSIEKDSYTTLDVVSIWITWDTNNLYGALGGYANGQRNNIFMLFDTTPDKGTSDFTTLEHGWNRELKFEALKPDFYLGIWTDYDNGSSLWNITWNGDEHGGGAGYEFWYVNENGSTTDSDPTGKFRPKRTDFTNPDRPWAGYTGRGLSDPNHTDNYLFFKIPWKLLTTRVTGSYVGLTNWKIKMTAASTGDDVRTGRAIFDWVPESRYGIQEARDIGVEPVQNNYLEVTVTDGSGNFILGQNMRSSSDVRFYPGSIRDLRNDPEGNIPFTAVDLNGNEVKGIAPGFNQTVYFKLVLEYNTVYSCYLYVYDIRGRKIRTVTTTESGDTFETPLGSGTMFNENPSVEATDNLSWDGKDDHGNVVPMGVYFVIFKGQDGPLPFLRKIPIIVVK